jgi:hypothetical protein
VPPERSAELASPTGIVGAEVPDAATTTPDKTSETQDVAAPLEDKLTPAPIEGVKDDHSSLPEKPHNGLNSTERKGVGRINRYVLAPIFGSIALGLGKGAQLALENGHQLPLAVGSIIIGGTFAASSIVAAFGGNSTKRWHGQRQVVKPPKSRASETTPKKKS